MHQNYIIEIATNEQPEAATRELISISLVGTLGASPSMPLGKWYQRAFRAGQTRSFSVECESIGELIGVELHNGGTSKSGDWLIDTVTVTTGAQRWVLPHYGWVLAGRSTKILEGTARLPQQQHAGANAFRAAQLSERQQAYQWASAPGLPGWVALTDGEVPPDDRFSQAKTKAFVTNKRRAMLNIALSGLLFKKAGALQHVDELKRYFTKMTVPGVVSRWHNDEEFGRQFVAGVAPTHLRSITELPPRFGVTEADVAGLLSGLSLADALRAKKMFLADYSILEPIETFSSDDEKRYCPPAMCLLHLDAQQRLMPVAIQLGNQQPVFTPKDSTLDWLAAKLYVKCAEGNVHQMITHAMRTHLCTEPAIMALLRNVSPQHPVFKLLRRHTRSTLAINAKARVSLLGRGGVFDEFIATGGKQAGHMALAKADYKNWQILTNSVPDELRSRGVDDPAVLPDYPYRDDTLLLWNAIGDYVKETLALFYTSDSEVAADSEIQAFYAEYNQVGHQGVRTPWGPTLSSVKDLETFLTILIHTASAQHAAVNFGQYEHYAFILNAPLSTRQPPPTAKNTLADDALVKLLPTNRQCARQLVVVYGLSAFSKEEEFLLSGEGYREQYFVEPAAVAALERFRHRLAEISKTIHARNEKRPVPYREQLPERIPTSVAI